MIAAVAAGGFFGPRSAASEPRTNVVLILTDNHAAWSLGCYGNADVRTPHIDALAGEGIRFDRAFANNAVCSPTRATLLTGLTCSQHGVHCYLGAGGAQIGPDAYNTIAEFRSLPEILHERGYVCGLSGKWHLGDNLRPQEGFTYWVTKPHGHSRGFYNQQVIEDGKIRTEPTYLTDFWTDHGVKFIEQNKDRPFFLLLAYNGPYGLGGAMLEPVKNRHGSFYAEKPMKSFPREKPHAWLHNHHKLINNPQAMRKYAAEISGIDDGVGRIVQTLEKHGLHKKTLVIFTADQGMAGGHGGFWGMGDHTRPLTAFDPMISIPLIFRHAGRIPAGKHSEILVGNYDLLPTVLTYLGLADKIPTKPPLPGRSFAPVLQGKSIAWDDVVFYEFENVRAVRTADWKYVERIHQAPNELYDLKNDPGERKNLIGKPQHADVQKQLQDRLHQFFGRYAEKKWDLWQGGRSKTALLTGKLFKQDP